ncbi:MAG: IS4 family transposase, partial [Gammaproteobacteria bacterium]|nr:IS4 family transposase [Gammaproteobacteria bacterium]
ALLLDGCRPIIVTDAGFRVPWFTLVASLGWDYVGRVRNRTFCKNETDKDWHPIKDLYAMAALTPKALGTYRLCRRNPVVCQLHVYRAKPKGRKDLIVTDQRAHKNALSRKCADREREPWLLATSLTGNASIKAKR